MGELEIQLSERMRIHSDTFCGRCGYNLRTRSILGRCPECGSEYDARPTVQKCILRDEDIAFPFAGIGGTLLSGALGLGAIVGASRMSIVWPYVVGTVFLLLAACFCVITFRQAWTYFRHRSLLRSAGRGE